MPTAPADPLEYTIRLTPQASRAMRAEAARDDVAVEALIARYVEAVAAERTDPNRIANLREAKAKLAEPIQQAVERLGISDDELTREIDQVIREVRDERPPRHRNGR